MTKKPKRRITKAARQQQELSLLMKLQRDHGYMFGEYPLKRERHITQFHRNTKTGSYSLTPARRITLVAPDESHIAEYFEKRLKQDSGKTKARKVKP